ncbi:MAG: tetratricopeptide repeat protein [Thermodesulfobacteriota bacterium]
MNKERGTGKTVSKEGPVFNTLTYASLLEKQGYLGEAKRVYEALLSTYPRREVIKRRLERLNKVA